MGKTDLILQKSPEKPIFKETKLDVA